MDKKLILIVDDVALNRRTARDVLEEEYNLLEAESGKQALMILENTIPDLILLDIVMPELDGYETMKVIMSKSAWKKIPVIFLTANTDPESEEIGFDLGAVDYITKPFIASIMKRRVKTQMALAAYRNELESIVEEQVAEITLMQDMISVGFVELVECRDGITGGHARNASVYFQAFVEEIRKEDKFKNDITDADYRSMLRAAPLHDVGKIAIRDDVLLKAGRLDDEQMKYMKTHTILGGQTFKKILRKIPNHDFIKIAEDMAMYHHERWDGNGYPKGLKGEEIPLSARIMSIVDVYDALTAKRPYKEPYDHKKAMAIIVEGRGTLFDPDLTDIFIRISPKIEECLNDCRFYNNARKDNAI